MTLPDRPDKTRPNFAWIVTTFSIGALVVLGTVVMAGTGAQLGLLQSFLINVGSAVLLLGVLGFVEPRLRRAYIEATDRRIEAVTHDVEDRLASRVTEVEEEVKSARALFEEYMAAEDATVASAAEHPDFYSIASALAAANQGGAIGRSGVAVAAVEGIPAVVIRFQYLRPAQSRGKDVLKVTAVITDSAHWMRDIDLVWRAGDASEQVGAELMMALRDAGTKDVDQKIDWAGTVGRLVAALALAMESRRSAGHLDGALMERGPADWALTSTGIEHLEHGVIAGVKSFPLEVVNALAKLHQVQNSEEYDEPWKAIEQPSWADNDEWSYIMTRARRVLPGSDLPVLVQPPFVRSTTPPRMPGAVGGFDFGR